MENETKDLVLNCQDTLVVHEMLILPAHTNPAGNLYGGELLYLIDNVASLAAHKATRCSGVTASLDNMNFISPFKLGEIVRIECYVTGTGHRSLEVFVKVIGENYQENRKFIGATSFLTFVATPKEDEEFTMPKIQPETDEERYICAGYGSRRKIRQEQRKEDQIIQEKMKHHFH
ncbi:MULTISPECIES: acyl-CoA thioesterase [Aerococcus]|uniref:acyl-CoA thioesterase n=1 Tax=Aerococcus urinae (strain CCUG 59500 / ACS-120-V-Col10a) TaxID=2976812 RepID=UPI000200F3BA|nr:hotdog domain-containing protein [Aerococcus sp. Group 1]AEA00461.1 thioesterase family protein [Aerococcus sp. Group 1]MCY3031649.1 acyl-CoA thioesterase [Aerococcus sp. Group 1]MCY3055767.1 acyl-CoA thioesterase [Aerococcus sp. Group 1]MCY3057498.1 acyl-CoA thioesterase [Aerococcus sp. Group 1]MCY3062777.1 acyl-CoA thioesterase [Aerococcus sp. Group 1]